MNNVYNKAFRFTMLTILTSSLLDKRRDISQNRQKLLARGTSYSTETNVNIYIQKVKICRRRQTNHQNELLKMENLKTRIDANLPQQYNKTTEHTHCRQI